eukprot:Nk52_evm76s2192 gene=Nk52_evmTU76s2192
MTGADVNNNNQRYEAVPTYEESQEEVHGEEGPVVREVEETENNAPSEAVEVDLEPVEATTSSPPQYDAVNKTELPSYEEVERAKQDEESSSINQGEGMFGLILQRVHVEGGETPTIGGVPLGDDYSFICGLLVTAIFNWIGYLAAYFLSTTIAGKCGATSGLGIVLIKVGFLLNEFSHKSTKKAHHGENTAMITGLFVLLGSFILIRGLTLYLSCKREAVRVSATVVNVA